MAGMIPNEVIEEIRAQANIVDLIGQYVQLSRRGKNYMGLCPFHEEKTPSFSVSEERQLYHCFSCGRGGNVFKFLMDLDDLSFRESVQEVAKKINYQLDLQYTGRQNEDSLSFVLRKMYASTKEFYAHILSATKTGEEALRYLTDRGLTEETISTFNLGFAPEAPHVLLEYLKQQNYTEEQMRQSGLFSESKTGELFDRFRGRVMFPLKDQSGQTVGFSGRKLTANDSEPKYLNSPETKIFTKSNLLFNFDLAKNALKNEQRLILFEGYMDVISAYQAGVKSGIASMGTSLTDDQIYLIRRTTKNLLINYDGDEPGQNATSRALSLFKQKAPQLEIGVVVLPDLLDPDEYLKKYGVEKFKAELNGALTPLEFSLQNLKRKYNLNNDREKIAYSEEALNYIATEESPIAQELYLDQISKETDISIDALKAGFLKAKRKKRQVEKNTSNPYPSQNEIPVVNTQPVLTKLDAPMKAQIRLLFLSMHHLEVNDRLIAEDFHFPNQNFAKIFDLWQNYRSTHEIISVNSFLDYVPEELKRIIVTVELFDLPTDYEEQEFDDQLQTIRNFMQRNKISILQQKLAEAKRKNDTDAELELTMQIINLRRSMNL